MGLVTLEEAKRQPLESAPIPFPQDRIDEMFQTMRDYKGIGLAGPQIGLMQNVFILGLHEKQHYVVCNPRLTVLSRKLVVAEEGCLTLPFERYVVPRWKSVQLEGTDEHGNPIKWACLGLLGRVVQHEYDHLLGRCICDTATHKFEPGKKPGERILVPLRTTEATAHEKTPPTA